MFNKKNVVLLLALFLLLLSVSSASAYDLETAYNDNYVNGFEFLEINTNEVSYGWNVTKKAFTPAGDECFNNNITDDEFLALYKSRNVLNKTNDGELKKRMG